MTLENLSRIVQMRGVKADVESYDASLEETIIAYATDTSEFGIYTNGAWVWLGAGGAVALDDLTDVDLTTSPPNDGDVLVYDDYDGTWYPDTQAGGSGALDDLTDVNAPTPNDDDVLTWDDVAGEWVAAAPAGGAGDVATDTIWDAKGDLAVGTGSNTASRLAAGTNGHVLTLDSAEATGVKWAAGGSGGYDFGATVLQRTVVAAGGQASFDLSSISADYDYLEIIIMGAAEGSATKAVYLYFNNDTTATNYRNFYHYGGYTTGNVDGGLPGDTPLAGYVSGVSETNAASMIRITIPNYANATFQKVASCIGGRRYSATSGLAYNIALTWENANAINRVTLVTSDGTEFNEGTLCLIVGYK